MWTTIILIPKGKGGYRGIGLLETIWEVCPSIFNIRIRSSIVLHDVLHRFRQGRGTGAAIIEAKLEQQLTGIVHEPLFQVFVDVRKACDSLDQGRYMEILRDYGLVPQIQKLLQRYWDRQRVVKNAGKYYGQPFSPGRGLMQGYPVSLALFNIIVDAVFRSILQKICGA